MRKRRIPRVRDATALTAVSVAAVKRFALLSLLFAAQLAAASVGPPNPEIVGSAGKFVLFVGRAQD
jgi:hypothetical protein